MIHATTDKEGMSMDLRALSHDERRVFEILQKDGPRTKKYLEERLGWTPSTTNRVIQSLLQKTAIQETGFKESTGGRRPSVFDIRADACCLLGLDFAHGYVRMALCDLKLRLLEEETLLVPPARDDPEVVLEAVSRTFDGFLARRGISREAVLGAGLGMFGPVDRETGVTGLLMDYDQPIGAWSGIPIRDMLRERLGVPVCADASCNCGALAEYACAPERDDRDTAYFICDIGFTVGQVCSGRILRRPDGRYDGFAHVSIDMTGKLCHCGKRGCVHLYASVRAIVQRIRQQALAGTPVPIPGPIEQANFGHVIEAAARKDPTATAALAEAGNCFGEALSTYLSLLRPDDLVLDGTLAETETFCRSVQETLARYHAEELSRRIRFRRMGSYGRMTVAVGAAALYYETLMKNPVLS